MAHIKFFSVIIPTYTGADNIEYCLSGILRQKDLPKGVGYEVIIVIDGPNDSLRKNIEQVAAEFQKASISLIIHQHTRNEGRFEARRTGARLARYNQLLFVDDRAELMSDFLAETLLSEELLLLPNVIEKSQPNMLSRLVYLIRRRVYGKGTWGIEYQSYYIDKANFEFSPKGTTALWVPKKVFLQACETVTEALRRTDTKHISDDTRLLRTIVNRGLPIYRPSHIKIYYQPRQKFFEELRHLYQRGPKFVDYYFKRGSRFRPHLAVGFVGTLAVIALIVLGGWVAVAGIATAAILSLLGLAVFLQERPSDMLVVTCALPLAACLFGVGIIQGMARKAYYAFKSLYKTVNRV